jgi:aspartate racemase
MKILGLVGGTSWVSTLDYYKLINKGVNEKLGDLNFAECVIYSFNYQDIKRNNDADAWDKNLEMIAAASLKLQNSGAKGIVLCANTMHLIADELQAQIDIPVIHIATATANDIKAKGLKKVGMLGTRFTMERDFFRLKLEEKGIEMLIPEDDDRGLIHYTIFEELGRGIFTPETKKRYLEIMDKLIAAGAEGIIAGCTEIPLLIKQDEVNFPLFDTLALHAKAAVEFALS